ncbi:hypothetical protein GIB67_007346 [Kingdonia uniflora]|uniref:CASP-like protein n=1 Tax=Kingdonia uniflora TaxID=39325 RepID=A0A7J7NXA2_9MAGN|nr:hypothetical protein GIB67_007346 [Kingdonia uniflora]
MKGGGSDEVGEASKVVIRKSGVSKGVSILDFILRIVALIGTLASAIAMGTTNETLPFFTQFIRFKAEYNEFPTFTFFVVANSVVSAYLVLSLPTSIFHIVRSGSKGSRIILIFLDTVSQYIYGNAGSPYAGASAATAIVYLAHKGNVRANCYREIADSGCSSGGGCRGVSPGGNDIEPWV